MAEVRLNTPLYKVTMTEYERGYGQRPMGERFFDTEVDAKAFCTEYNSDPGDPDCFYRASYTRVA
jgi:hypothetical protein